MLGTCNNDINKLVEETLVCTHIISTMSGTLTTLPFPTFFVFHREDLDVFARNCAAGSCFSPGAPGATSVHMQVESNGDFLPGRVSQPEHWKLANTHNHDIDDDLRNCNVGQTARTTVDSPGANVDGSNNPGSNILHALVVPTGGGLGEDGVALVAVGVENMGDVVIGPHGNALLRMSKPARGMCKVSKKQGRK